MEHVEKMESAIEENEPTRCIICNVKIGKFHLKVSACRACTVFFRRSVQTGRQYKCQLGYKSCNLRAKTKGKPLCRFCRLEKCKELGMKLERVRRKVKKEVTTKSEVSSPTMPSSVISSSAESVIKSPIPIHPLHGSPCSSIVSKISEKKQFLNAQPVEQKIKEILSQPVTSIILAPGVRLTFLQQLCLNFPSFYDEIRSKQPVTVTNVFDRLLHFQFIHRWWTELAKLLMKCEQFAALAFEDKWLLYKHLWLVFYKLERYYSSFQIFGTSFNDNKILYDDTTALDYCHPDLTIKEFETLEKCEQWKKYDFNRLWAPIREKYIRSIINPMKALNISQYELIYILAQILWSYQDIANLSPNVIRIAEEISDQISNELHDYFINQKHLNNYAPRLTKINKIIASAETIQYAKKDMQVITRIFNFFDLEVVGSELSEI